MKVINIKKVIKEKLGAPLFTGNVTKQSAVSDKEGADINVDYINFSRGVHNKFHKHTNDQMLIVVKGRGFIETKKEKHKLEKGDVVWSRAGEVHRHGAIKNASFTHVAITRSKTKLTQIEN